MCKYALEGTAALFAPLSRERPTMDWDWAHVGHEPSEPTPVMRV